MPCARGCVVAIQDGGGAARAGSCYNIASRARARWFARSRVRERADRRARAGGCVVASGELYWHCGGIECRGVNAVPCQGLSRSYRYDHIHTYKTTMYN